MYAIYKYVYDNKIIYIGKTNSSLKNRLICHSNESKFQPFLEADIFYFEVANKTETEIFEKILINKYHPRLNVVDNYEESINIVFQEPQWIKIDRNIENQFPEETMPTKQKRIPQSIKRDIEIVRGVGEKLLIRVSGNRFVPALTKPQRGTKFNITDSIIIRDDLKPIEKIVLLLLLTQSESNTNHCKIKQRTLTQYAGVDIRTLRRTIDSLTEKGFIRKETNFDEMGSREANTYYLDFLNEIKEWESTEQSRTKRFCDFINTLIKCTSIGQLGIGLAYSPLSISTEHIPEILNIYVHGDGCFYKVFTSVEGDPYDLYNPKTFYPLLHIGDQARKIFMQIKMNKADI